MGEAVEKIVPDGRVKIDLEKALDLRIKGVPVSDIAKLFKVTETQVYRRLKRYKTDPANVVDFRKSKAKKMEFIQAEILASITPEDIKKTPFIQRVTSFGILEDKIRLIRGESTSNVNLQGVLANATGDLDRIRERIQGLLSGETVTTATQHIVGQEEGNEDKVVASKKVNDNKGL